ncbi:MAG: response regulator [Cyanobacteria bacterium P01_C01_bin.69]
MSPNIAVLLVEDNFSDTKMVEALFSSSDLAKPTLHHAGKFQEALSMLRESRYDLVLLDLHLPDGEGLNLIKQLKQQVPEIPVVVLTDDQDDSLAVKALHEGAQDYVLKSDTFSPTRLAQMGLTNLGNWLVRRIQYAVQRAEIVSQLAKKQQGQDQQIDQTHNLLEKQADLAGVWDWDIKNDSLYFSPCWQALLGLKGPTSNASVSTGNGISQWLLRIHPQDKARFNRTLQGYLNRQQPQFYCEYRIRQANGDYIWVMAKGEALWNSAGVAYRIAGSQIDITHRKQTEETAYCKKKIVPTTLHAVSAGLLSIHANLLANEGRYEEAEPLLQSALALRRLLIGRAHPDIGISLYNLASLYDNQFRFSEAESLFREALTVFEKTLGPQNPHTQKVRAKVDIICRLNQAMKLAKAEIP